MTFKIELNNHNILKQAFESITKIVDEIALEFDTEGMHLRALDRSHITFITLELDKTFFDEYQCDKPERLLLDAGDFLKALKKCKTNDILQFDIDDSSLTLIMKGDATRKFKIQFIDFEYDSPVPPTIDVPCNISIPSNLLETYIKDMSDFNEKLTFLVDQDYFKIIADGQTGSGEIEYLHGENINEIIKSHFSIPKLLEIMKASKFSEETKLGIGDDMPLILRMDLVTGDGHLEYLLAPRLEESD